MAGYTIQSFGCRASAADGESIAAALEAHGLVRAQPDEAGLVVLNTCAVTESAERDARAAIRRARRRNPGARIVVTGCYAQRAPQELARIEGVSAVIGNSHKALAAQAAAGWVSAETLGTPQVLHAPFASRHIAGEHADSLALPPAGAGERTRVVVRVQEGCGNRCSFCVIPETRGPSRSLPQAAVLEAVRRHVDAGVQEVVLSGINLGRWGRELRPAGGLAALVESLLRETALARLRLSSIEPMDWDDGMLGLFAEYAVSETPRLAPHAHLPLQSGSDTVLRRMHRRYRPWHFEEKLRRLHSLCEDMGIGSDIMVGFPGETDAEFAQTCTFIERNPFTYLHLFPYSPRPNTAAEAWHRASPVPAGVVRERMRALEALGRAKHREHMQRFVGRELSAVTLRGNRALTANFLPVRLTEPTPANRLGTLRVASIDRESETLTAGTVSSAVRPAPAIPADDILRREAASLRTIGGSHR